MIMHNKTIAVDLTVKYGMKEEWLNDEERGNEKL